MLKLFYSQDIIKHTILGQVETWHIHSSIDSEDEASCLNIVPSVPHGIKIKRYGKRCWTSLHLTGGMSLFEQAKGSPVTWQASSEAYLHPCSTSTLRAVSGHRRVLSAFPMVETPGSLSIAQEVV
jgi:hypothetical protein